MNIVDRAVSPLGGLADREHDGEQLGFVPYGSLIGRRLVLNEVKTSVQVRMQK